MVNILGVQTRFQQTGQAFSTVVNPYLKFSSAFLTRASFISVEAMEATKTSRKKTNGNVGHRDLDEPKKNQYRVSKSIEENEKMKVEMQQQMSQIERKITERKLYHEKTISGLAYNLRYGWVYNERWALIEDDQNFRSGCAKKMELDKLTFANKACRDKKAVISFSSGEREININNLNHRMSHDAHSMNGERRLLKMLNPSKDIDSGLSLKQIEEQMWKVYSWMKWPQYYNSTIDVDECERKLRELEWERDQVFVNSPSKASLWKTLPSTKDLRDQIHAMEARDEEKREMVLGRRKKIEPKERKIKKGENEIKSLKKMMEMIRNRQQRALNTISHEETKRVV